jgi:glutamate carboxypeptidase
MTALTEREEQAVAAAHASPMLERTRAWSAVNSGTGNIDGLARVAEMLARDFGALPGTLRLVAPAAAERVGTDGSVSAVPHGQHLHLSVRSDAERRLLLTGHMDTVYPADHPFQTLTDRPDGTINGPGVADMKGGLAVMLAALEAVEAVGCPIGYDVVINSDEETGSFSSADLIAASARGKLAALTYEPALPDGTLAGARGGTGNFSIVVRGRAAHAGRNPEDGRNAIVAAAALALALNAAKSPRLAVNPARIDGGGPNNVVPDLAVLRVNFRPKDLAEIDRARASIDTAVAEIAAAHDVSIEVHGSFNRPPKPIDAGAQRLFDLVQSVGADMELPIAWRDTGGVCDGNNIAAAGTPVIDTMGVRGGAIHSSDEYLIVDSLAERAALSTITILRLAENGL